MLKSLPERSLEEVTRELATMQPVDQSVRDAVLEGLMVAGDDKRLLELFRASTNDREKRRMLRMLVHMDSDAALEIIDSTLQGQD
jgi:hypothetical protein